MISGAFALVVARRTRTRKPAADAASGGGVDGAIDDDDDDDDEVGVVGDADANPGSFVANADGVLVMGDGDADLQEESLSRGQHAMLSLFGRGGVFVRMCIDHA